MNISDSEIKSINSKLIELQQLKSEITLGQATKLLCPCDGILHEYSSGSVAPKPPIFSKRKRIRNKQMKRWREANLHLLIASAVKSRGYCCIKCNRRFGFYEAFGLNMVKVEPIQSFDLPE